MANENEEVTTETATEENGNKMYLDAIAQLKASSVSKDEYEKLKRDNDNLLKAVVNGEKATAETPEEKRDIDEIRKELFSPKKELNDIEYVTKALELRKRVMEETGEDCFVPKAHGYMPTQDAYDSAQRTADVFEQCLEYANGDNQAFINELQRRTNDVRLPRR